MRSNAAKSFLAMLIIVASGLASIPILTRHLAPNDFGHVSLLLMMFSLMAAFDGFRAVIIYCYPKYHNDCEGFFFTVSSILWVVAGMAAILSFGVLQFVFSDQFTGPEILMISLAAAIYYPMTGKWGVLDAAGKVGSAALIRASVWFFVYASFVVLAVFKGPLLLYTIVLLLMNITLYIIFSLFVRKDVKAKNIFDNNMASILISKAKSFLLFQVSAYSVTLIDRFFLAKLLPIYMLGFYTPQYELGTRSTTPIRALNSVLYPRFSSLVAKGEGELVRKNWLLATKGLFAVFSLLVWVVVNRADFVVELYAGSDYAKYSIVLKIIMVGALINLFGFMASLLLNAFGNFQTQGRVYMMAALVGLVVAYPMISTWGIVGAALTYVIMRFADIVLFLSAWRKFVRKPINGCIALMALLVLVFLIQLTVSEYLSAVFLVVFYVILIDLADIKSLRNIIWRET